MPQSAKSLLRSGVISTKAFNATLAKTRVEKAKMASFHGKGRKDEGGVRDRGEVPSRELNHPTNQAASAPGVKAPRGKSSARKGQPRTAHIDREQGPLFPAGGIGRGEGGRPKAPRALRGTTSQSGPGPGGARGKGPVPGSY